ncbi:glutamate synthase subunit beta [Butyrivibrio sp. AE3009]|uniref:glutamate synthase subunit beta n=1 Tax=Butyrivibrio sp. AE3009 TaxID=1280666 RepID=UPI0003B6AB48|nr:glutamate synthase subunit beta [Butyrivibrio sp. AE3009]
MGKATGFLEYKRIEDKIIPVDERILNFKEFHNHLDAKERKLQGARCMNCGVPMCQSAIKLKGMVTGCPLHNLIPEWNDEIYHDHIQHALSRLLKTSNFPEFTGRVCPALCEKACVCGINDDPVTVHNNELYIIETAFKEGYMKPRIPKVRSGKKVAVIGSGPSGLAVADQLNRRGHSVTVYEREDRIGGLLMYGIPNMKLQKEIIFRRQKLMEEEGVVFKTGVNVGVDITAEELNAKYDAIALCCGAKKPRPLGVKGFEEVKGVHYAVDFLKSTTKSLLENDLKDGTFISAKDKHVVVVGGGDTGNDCVGTCIRHGCRSITQLEMMPAPPTERLESNPWPEWPKVLKTDYGQQEAIAKFGHDPRIYETTVKELVLKKDKLSAIKTVQVKFENGKLTEVPGTEKEIKCELLLIAAGFVGCQEYTADAFKVKLTQRGVVETAPGAYKTGKDKVFTAGDMHRGQSLVVWAIVEGRECAMEIDEFLMGYTNL